MHKIVALLLVCVLLMPGSALASVQTGDGGGARDSGGRCSSGAMRVTNSTHYDGEEILLNTRTGWVQNSVDLSNLISLLPGAGWVGFVMVPVNWLYNGLTSYTKVTVQQKEANYYSRRLGQYCVNGAWRTGVEVHLMQGFDEVEVLGPPDEAGQPTHLHFDHYVGTHASGHYWDDSWILGMTAHHREGYWGRTPIVEDYWDTFDLNP